MDLGQDPADPVRERERGRHQTRQGWQVPRREHQNPLLAGRFDLRHQPGVRRDAPAGQRERELLEPYGRKLNEAGTGAIDTYCINYQKWTPVLDVPYVEARVRLDGVPGVVLTTNIVGCPVEEVDFDDPVRVVAPTSVKRGRPGATWHCTSTARASSPR